MIEEALAAAREAGAETEIVLVAGKSISPCDACQSCWKTGVCRIEDDMQPIYKQLEAADGIIFGTPVYFCSVTAQAKAVMDRMYAYLPERTKMRGKVAGPIVVTRRTGAAQSRNLLYSFFIAHKMIVTRAGIGYGREKGEVREGVGGPHGTTALEEARTVAKDVVDLVALLSKAKN
jgi:multimeric flavodoxin WrbA